MSFGNSNVFPFPAVQYIPLPLTDLQLGIITKNSPKTQMPLIIAGEAELARWQSVLSEEYNLALSEITDPNSFPILALNLKVTEIKYRGFFVTMVGQCDPSKFQLFTIPSRYFYKKTLFFELYDRTTAKRLAHYSLFMPKGV